MPVGFNRAASAYLRPAAKTLVAAPAGAWTISVWVCPQTAAGSVRNVWYLNNGHVLQLNGASIQFIYGGGIDTLGSVAAWTGSNYGPWTHVAVTKNSTTEARYYVNGAYVGNRTAGLSTDAAIAASVGAYNAQSDFFTGAMAALKAWNRVLTAAEVEAESRMLLPVSTTSLSAAYPFAAGYTLYRDMSGNGRDMTAANTGASAVRSPLPWGAPGQVMGLRDLSVQTVYAGTFAPVIGYPAVSIEGGSALERPNIELAYDAANDGLYSSTVGRERIRAVNGSYGFKGTGVYLSDNASVKLEIRNEDGAFTQGGGLWVGMWCKVRLAGTGEVLFTGRITDLTPGYGASRPYVSVTVETARNDLSIPAQSVLLKDTNTAEAVKALLADIDLTNGGGWFIFDWSEFDGPDLLAPSGNENVRVYGNTFMGLAAAGGYGKSDGELNVLSAIADLTKADDGRAVWGRDGLLELYGGAWLDEVRDADEAAYTLRDDVLVSTVFSLGSDYINDLTLKWTPSRWQAGAAVYTYEPESASAIKPGEYRDFSIRFRMDSSDRILAAENPVVSVTQTGPAVGTLWLEGVKATGGTLRVTNPDATAAASITKIAITANALIQSEAAEVRLQDNGGVTFYGMRGTTLETRLIDRETQAVARAEREFAARNERVTYVSRVELKPRSRAEAVQWMTLPFATLVAVQSDRLRHNARYLAIGTAWRVGEGGAPVDITLFLEPVTVGGLFTFDDDDKGFDAGRLA